MPPADAEQHGATGRHAPAGRRGQHGETGQHALVEQHGETGQTGLIVGRFDPPHLGHSFMIDWAAQRCDQLVVFVNSSEVRDTAPGDLRARWLAELHPNVQVREVRHRLGTDFDDEDLWAKWMALFRSEWPLEVGPHIVFSSDGYVNELASRFGAESVVVDADRATVPISATQVREAPADHLDLLAPPVRSWVEANWL